MEPDRHLTPPTHHDTNLAVNSLRCLRPNSAVILISLVVLLAGASDVVRAEGEPPKRVEVMESVKTMKGINVDNIRTG